MADLPALPTPGQKPWSLNPHITAMNAELNGRLSSDSLSQNFSRAFEVDARNKGAVLNGTTDDTAAIQAAISECAQAGGGNVLIAGRAKVSNLTLPTGVGLKGIGRIFSLNQLSRSEIIGASGVDTITFSTSSYVSGNTVENLRVYGGRRAIAIVNHGVVDLKLKNVRLSGSEAGFYCDTWIERSSFEDVEFTAGQYGVRFVNNGTINNYVDKNTWNRCRFDGQTINAFRLSSYRACNLNYFGNFVVNGSQQTAMVIEAPMVELFVENYSSEFIGNAAPTLGYTTGTIAAGSNSISVASASNFVVGQSVVVASVGAGGTDLVTSISEISGTSITLATTATVAGTGVEITNALYDDWNFSTTGTAGGISSVTFAGGWLGNGTNRVRYALAGNSYQAGFVRTRFNRPVDDRDARSFAVGCTGGAPNGRFRTPSLYASVPRAYGQLIVGDGFKTVLPGVPGRGTVLSLIGDGDNNQNTGSFGNLSVVKTDVNRNELFRIDGTNGTISTGLGPNQRNLLHGLTTSSSGGNRVIEIANVVTAPTSNFAGGTLYVDAGALKFRGSSGTITTLGPA